MPSPFPGMNPYLEQEIIWHDFHERFLPALAALLVAQIRPKYFVLIDENVYLHDLPPEPARLGGRPDLSVSRGTGSVSRSATAGVLEAPARIVLPVQDVESESFLTIRDRRNREIVTVIEVLSPTNKRAPGSISCETGQPSQESGPSCRDRLASRRGAPSPRGAAELHLLGPCQQGRGAS